MAGRPWQVETRMYNLMNEMLLHLNEVEGQTQVSRQKQQSRVDRCEKCCHGVMEQVCEEV